MISLTPALPVSQRHPQDEILRELVEAGVVSAEDAGAALRQAAEADEAHGALYALIERGVVGARATHPFLARRYREEVADLTVEVPDPDAIATMPGAVARHARMVPLRVRDGALRVACLDPYDLDAIQYAASVTRHRIETRVTDEHSLRRALRAAYGTRSDAGHALLRADAAFVEDRVPSSVQEVEDAVASQEIPQFVTRLLVEAVQRRASDLHFEFYEGGGRVRFRIDGTLVQVAEIPAGRGRAIAKRIKVSAHLNNAQDRIPEDGTLKLTLSGRVVDFRVSTLPVATGHEKVVLRVLERGELSLSYRDLGMTEPEAALLTRALRRPKGMVLVTGPTGSGKSTTLYACLSRLNGQGRNITTVEDPVERLIPGINQVQVRPNEDPRLNFDYEIALRSILRQDPNVIMVGEIRDAATAQIALRAAMTGHLLLSTAHTNDAPSAVTRLINIGIEPHNIAASLSLVIAQRLVKRICDRCRVPHAPTPHDLADAGLSAGDVAGIPFQRGAGCDHCDGTGYRGRVGIYEFLPLSPAIHAAVAAGRTESEIRALAREEGMVPLSATGIRLVREGVTTLEQFITEINF